MNEQKLKDNSANELKKSLLSLKEQIEEYESLKEKTIKELETKIEHRFKELLKSDVYVEFSVLGYTNQHYRYFLENENLLVIVYSLNLKEIVKEKWVNSDLLFFSMECEGEKVTPKEDFSISIEDFQKICSQIQEEFNIEIVLKKDGRYKKELFE